MLAVIVLPACAGSGKQIKMDDTDESAAVVSEVAPVDDRTVEPLPVNEAGDYSIYGEVISGPFTEIPITAGERDPLIDRTQETVYGVVNSSTQWFDSFFGSARADQGNNVRQGSVTLGAQWDQREGAEPIARMRVRVPLSAFRERTRLVFGRGNAEQFVDGTTDGNSESLPRQFNDFEDDDWLLGVGYSRKGELSSGLRSRLQRAPEAVIKHWNHYQRQHRRDQDAENQGDCEPIEDRVVQDKERAHHCS